MDEAVDTGHSHTGCSEGRSGGFARGSKVRAKGSRVVSLGHWTCRRVNATLSLLTSEKGSLRYTTGSTIE